jgi:hypothetical protein
MGLSGFGFGLGDAGFLPLENQVRRGEQTPPDAKEKRTFSTAVDLLECTERQRQSACGILKPELQARDLGNICFLIFWKGHFSVLFITYERGLANPFRHPVTDGETIF